MNTNLAGQSFVGYSRSDSSEICGHGIQPETGNPLSPAYFSATPDDITKALSLASAAFPIFSNRSGKARAEFLRTIATGIEAMTEDILQRGMSETALAESRLRAEIGRTIYQLEMFADQIEEGAWVDARIERGQPDRQPIPKVDLRSMLRPLGPVAVFCAGNFPLAYSVAGGDTASALAAGCPVIVIAHEGHPGVAEIVAAAVIRAAKKCGMPEGVFSVLYGGGRTVGMAVVKDPVIQAVGFTGSRQGGMALMEAAAKRRQTIPVYAEMSSINPIVILPGALARGEEALAEAFFGSLTLGVGQFCTNPGLVFLPECSGDRFLSKLKSLIEAAPSGTMLNPGIAENFHKSTATLATVDGVEILARSTVKVGLNQASPVVFAVSMNDFLKDAATHHVLQNEMFGPATLLVRGGLEKTIAALSMLEGQLTASLHASHDELLENPALVAALQSRAGRLIFNGFPTGVQVCHSMVHGGPFPATSDGRTSSVGTMAIFRFCRPVAWQNFPDAGLPAELQEFNPLKIKRMEEFADS